MIMAYTERLTIVPVVQYAWKTPDKNSIIQSTNADYPYLLPDYL